MSYDLDFINKKTRAAEELAASYSHIKHVG